MEYSTTEEVANSERGLPQTLSSLRQRLGQKAKQEPKFRFYTLYGHISRDDVLAEAWSLVRANKGAAGIDGVTIEMVEAKEGGVAAFLESIQKDLRTKTYKPRPARRVFIPKANGRGYPRKAFGEINAYSRQRLYCYLSGRSQRPWRPPKGKTFYAQFARMGLIYL